MSKKPLKHSDQKKLSTASKMKKSWGQPSTRPTIWMRPEHYLIVTEGTGTEPAYFNEIKRRINSFFHNEYITVDIEGAGMNTLSLLDYAKDLAEKDDRYTQVWVVYDKDSFPSEYFNAVVEQCKKLNAHDIHYHAAWTNEAFELWFLLHFEFMQSALHRNLYEPKLTEHLQARGLNKYRKNRADMYNILEPYLATAIQNAKRLEDMNKGKNPADCNPGTMVHKLVEELAPYTKLGNLN